MTLPLGGVRDKAQEPSVDLLNDKAAQSLILYATPVSVSIFEYLCYYQVPDLFSWLTGSCKSREYTMLG